MKKVDIQVLWHSCFANVKHKPFLFIKCEYNDSTHNSTVLGKLHLYKACSLKMRDKSQNFMLSLWPDSQCSVYKLSYDTPCVMVVLYYQDASSLASIL